MTRTFDMNRRLFLAGTAAGVSALALSALDADPWIGCKNPAVMLRMELERLGATIKPYVQQDIDACEFYACADTPMFDMDEAVKTLAKKLVQENPEGFSFKTGRFERWGANPQDRGHTHRYKGVRVNVYEFQASNGHQPMVTVLRCGVCR
jgi:hypothetical protein